MDISSTSSAMDLMAIREEKAAMREQMMAKADTDSSGGLSIEEFSEAAANRPMGGAGSAEGKSIEDIFAEIDADGDGELTSAEMEEHREANKPPAPQMSAQTGSALTMLQESLNTSSTEDTSLVDALLEQLEASDEEDDDDDDAIAA